MAMAHQNIVALILLMTAILLLIRQVVRLFTGSNTGCSCAPWQQKPSDDDNAPEA